MSEWVSECVSVCVCVYYSRTNKYKLAIDSSFINRRHLRAQIISNLNSRSRFQVIILISTELISTIENYRRRNDEPRQRHRWSGV